MHILRRFIPTRVMRPDVIILVDSILYYLLHIWQLKIKFLKLELLFEYSVYSFCHSISVRIVRFSHAGYDVVLSQ